MERRVGLAQGMDLILDINPGDYRARFTTAFPGRMVGAGVTHVNGARLPQSPAAGSLIQPDGADGTPLSSSV